MNPEPKRGQPGYKSQWKPRHRNSRTGKPRESLEARFWKKVQLPEDRSQCWLWTGSKNNHGYGQIHSMEPDDPAMITAHRASLRIHGIDVPRGLVADHICKNKACVNPAHLRFVTQVENCTTLAAPNPFTKNKAKTHCKRGHPFSGANLALFYRKDMKSGPTRVCLTCWPSMWRWAVIPRTPPPGARKTSQPPSAGSSEP